MHSTYLQSPQTDSAANADGGVARWQTVVNFFMTASLYEFDAVVRSLYTHGYAQCSRLACCSRISVDNV